MCSVGFALRLKARTIGACQAWNRLMAFKPVRSSRPVQWTPCDFLPNPHYSCRRDDFHLSKFPDYPDPERLLSYTQRYFFRNVALRHLRVEQFTRSHKNKQLSASRLRDG